MAAAALALLGAAAWGAGDFLGGIAARRIHVLTVVAASQGAGSSGQGSGSSSRGRPRPASPTCCRRSARVRVA